RRSYPASRATDQGWGQGHGGQSGGRRRGNQNALDDDSHFEQRRGDRAEFGVCFFEAGELVLRRPKSQVGRERGGVVRVRSGNRDRFLAGSVRRTSRIADETGSRRGA